MTDHLRPPPPGWHIILDASNAIVGCDRCGHSRQFYSSEPEVGCLHQVDPYGPDGTWTTTCPCTEPGTSEADQ